MSPWKLSGVLLVSFAASSSLAAEAPDCARYRLYGLFPGMTAREVRDTMDDKGKVSPDKKSVDYYRPSSSVHLEFDDEVNRKSAKLVLVRSHIPTSVDAGPVLRSIVERLGEPTAGEESLEGGLEAGPATWIDGSCGIIVEISRQGEHLWDPTQAGIYIESRVMLLRIAEAPGAEERTPDEAVLDDLLVGTTVAVAASDGEQESSAPKPELVTTLAGPRAGSTSDETTMPQPIPDGVPSSANEVAVAGIGGVTYPERLQGYFVKPVYPLAAKQAKISAVVHVRVVVDEDGTVGEATIVRSSHEGAGFEQSALKAVKYWRYRPATRDGEPVPASILVKIDFI